MSKPYDHAVNSAKIFGGEPKDYLAIHQKMDSTKSVLADHRHRCIFHSAFGVFIIEDIFGTVITNSELKQVSVRDIAEQHILEDLGTIPSLQDWLQNMTIQNWMGKHTNQHDHSGQKIQPHTTWYPYVPITPTIDPLEPLKPTVPLTDPYKVID